MSDIDKLRAFAQAVLKDWPEGTPDIFDLQDLAVEYGLLVLKDPAPTEPCCENCHCAEYHGSDGFGEGVDCYVRSPLLLGAPGVKEVR